MNHYQQRQRGPRPSLPPSRGCLKSEQTGYGCAWAESEIALWRVRRDGRPIEKSGFLHGNDHYRDHGGRRGGCLEMGARIRLGHPTCCACESVPEKRHPWLSIFSPGGIKIVFETGLLSGKRRELERWSRRTDRSRWLVLFFSVCREVGGLESISQKVTWDGNSSSHRSA